MQTSDRSTPRSRQRRFSRPLVVLVPIYNGAAAFRELVDSLFRAYDAPDPMLTLVFIDDASPDPTVGSILQEASFRRPDVVVLRNESNRGFIGTVNRGLEEYCLGSAGSDVTILNSDTMIHGRPFEVLQEAAYRVANVASVTPLTNNGTIASIAGWPDGGPLPSLLTSSLIAETLEKTPVPPTHVPIPTGVGFCMYMTRAAVQAVGGFDPVFGKGYGEENHWCLTASGKGFVNLLCVETFVFHQGSQSFGTEAARKHQQRNLAILGKMHPRYSSDIMDFIRRDPLRTPRIRAQWAVRRALREQRKLRTVLFVLHSDPETFFGGTERHVKAMTEELLRDGRSEVLQLFSDGTGRIWHLRSLLPDTGPGAGAGRDRGAFISAAYESASLLELVESIAGDTDILHVQHFKDAPAWFMRLPELFPHALKVLTLHDYLAICPTVTLTAEGTYCGVPGDTTTCNDCLQSKLGLGHLDMTEYRRTRANFVRGFDKVVTPSSAALRLLERGFAAAPLTTGVERSPPPMSALPNFLPASAGASLSVTAPRSASEQRRVVFLGAFWESKGSEVFSAAVPSMRSQGWTPEVWGIAGVPIPPGVGQRAYRSGEDLRALAQTFPPDVVVIASNWPETFSYTTYEALIELGAPIVVGPFGNPAEVVRRHGVGRVLDELSPRELVAAVDDVLRRRVTFLEGLAGLRQEVEGLTVGNYIAALYGTASPRTGRSPPTGLLAAPLPPVVQQTAPATQGRPLRYAVADRLHHLLLSFAPGFYRFGKKWLLRRARR